ncbi:gp006 (endogenous virus) [Lactococcus phage KSY1]|uniref:Gp006 n=1 Tax=Lactococcus phage KSY1 TaxID=2913972 RepID=A6MA70_9CAUD|nr:gp006 [Lactococcus phage KSY1]ABG21548.1 gp006 [Lactococcus phage KSY1]
MTLKPIENDILLRVKHSLTYSNTVYLDEAMLNSVLELWNDYSNFDPDPELMRIKRLIFYATTIAKPSHDDYKIELGNAHRGTIMKKLLNVDLRYITDQEELERKLLKVGEKHNMVEVVINDEVNFKMQISKGDKLTLEITDQGVTKVSLSAPETKGE